MSIGQENEIFAASLHYFVMDEKSGEAIYRRFTRKGFSRLLTAEVTTLCSFLNSRAKLSQRPAESIVAETFRVAAARLIGDVVEVEFAQELDEIGLRALGALTISDESEAIKIAQWCLEEMRQKTGSYRLPSHQP